MAQIKPTRPLLLLCLVGLVSLISEMKSTQRRLQEFSTYHRDFYSQVATRAAKMKTAHSWWAIDMRKNYSDSPLNDKTIEWYPNVTRLWLSTETPPPPAMILWTNFGWNNQNQNGRQKGLGLYRTIRETEFVSAIVNHPWFHPTFWQESQENSARLELAINSTTRFYIFLDQTTCGESNYPKYGGGQGNRDSTGNRTTSRQKASNLRASLNHSFWEHPLLEQLPQDRVKVVMFDCGGWSGWGQHVLRDEIPKQHQLRLEKAAAAVISARMRDVRPEIDQGLPPPLPNPTHLSPSGIEDIETCEAEDKRDLLIVYAGNFRHGRHPTISARQGFRDFHDDQEIFITGHSMSKSKLYGQTYQQINARTVFALTPRGDNKFSYRFSEVLSAGAIPVVLADEWVLPFRPEVVNWDQCAIIVPEADSGARTIQMLRNITREERCQRRRYCYQIYQRYMSSPSKVINGILEGLERVLTKNVNHGADFAGVRCPSNASGEGTSDCNLYR